MLVMPSAHSSASNLSYGSAAQGSGATLVVPNAAGISHSLAGYARCSFTVKPCCGVDVIILGLCVAIHVTLVILAEL